jgi:3-deoxy-D-manno-octulosonic-acid transferase
MGLLLYNVFISLYVLGIRIASSFNEKAKKWINGRQGWEDKLLAGIYGKKKVVWFHCSSLGEFEQGRPVMETLKKVYPECTILLTFFSPSGYEIRHNYIGADHVSYLPADTQRNASVFLDIAKPELAVFVKYEFWYHYIHQLQCNKTPIILLSAAFRAGQVFFKPYGSFFREMLQNINFIFVQDKAGMELLAQIGITKNVYLGGDTRYDRVAAIARQVSPIAAIETFKEGKNILICGSTWLEDEKILAECKDVLPEEWKMIIAPHEIHTAHIQQIKQLFGDSAITYSELAANTADAAATVLIVDNIGMLSVLYSYGTIAYVGGGFNKGGIHNILEPAVFGLPVIFGPVFEKFVEAKKMTAQKLTFPVHNSAECRQLLHQLATNADWRAHLKTEINKYMNENTGATVLAITLIQKEKLLDK